MSEPVATEYDSDDLTTAYLAGLHRGGDAAAATITALRARVEALEGALARADRLIDALWTDQIVPDEHGGTRSAIRAALRAKGGE